MSSIRHAGDAIAHDLRSPLTRMRAKLEVALIDAEAGRIDGVDALGVALDEADHLLKTFNTVLAIARLQSGGAPDPQRMDAAALAADMAELYEPAAEDKDIDFSAEIETGPHPDNAVHTPAPVVSRAGIPITSAPPPYGQTPFLTSRPTVRTEVHPL
jgi:signal transduction histidine kinase